MSQLGNTRPTEPSRRRSTNEPNRLTLGIENSVAVAMDIPVVSEGARMAADLSRAFGLAGAVADDLAHRNRRLAAEQRERDRQAEQSDRGAAATHVAESFPELKQEIDQDRLVVPEGVKAVDFARGWVEARLVKAPAASEAFRDEYRSRMVPALTAALIARQSEHIEQNKIELGKVIKNAATGKTDPAALQAAAKDYSEKLGVSEQEGLTAVAVHAMGVAARQGDTAAFQAAKAALGELAIAEQTEATIELQRTLDRQEADRNDAFNRDIAAMYVRREPYENIRGRVRSYDGRINPELIDARLQEADQREREALRRATDAERRALITRESNRLVSEAAPMLDAGDSTGGAPFVQDREITLPDGSIETVRREEIIEGARQRKWAQIESEFAGNTEAILSAKLDWLGKNPGVTDPLMVAIWSGPWSRIDVGDTDATVPAALVQAYQLYRLAHALSPGVVAAQIQDSADEDFFRVAAFLHENSPDLTPETALATAARRWPRDPAIATRISDEIKESLLRKHARDVIDETANGSQASRIIEQRTRAYMIMGSGEEAAVREAVKHFRQDHTLINGVWVYTRGQAIKHVDLDQLGRLLVGKYAGDEGGQDPRGFTLTPDDTQGSAWFISMGDSRFPAPGSPRFSSGDLTVLWKVAQDELHRQARLKIEAMQAAALAELGMATQSNAGPQFSDFKQPLGRTETPPKGFSLPPPPRVKTPETQVPDHLKPWASFIVKELRTREPRTRSKLPAIGNPFGMVGDR